MANERKKEVLCDNRNSTELSSWTPGGRISTMNDPIWYENRIIFPGRNFAVCYCHLIGNFSLVAWDITILPAELIFIFV